MSLFSERLIEQREKMGWTRKRAVSELGMPYSTYAGYEQAHREPDIDTLKLIAKKYETTTDYLTGNTDDPSPASSNASAITSTDLDKMLDNARSFDGKPMSDHDREIIKNYLKGYYDAK